VNVVTQVCAELAGAIEERRPHPELDLLVAAAVSGVLARTGGIAPHRAILGCTHFPIVEHLFARHLPPSTRLLSQPDIVCNSLDDYLARHPRYTPAGETGGLTLLTTGDPRAISEGAAVFWSDAPRFEHAD
jgi:glutamate racemase